MASVRPVWRKKNWFSLWIKTRAPGSSSEYLVLKLPGKHQLPYILHVYCTSVFLGILAVITHRKVFQACLKYKDYQANTSPLISPCVHAQVSCWEYPTEKNSKHVLAVASIPVLQGISWTTNQAITMQIKTCAQKKGGKQVARIKNKGKYM